MDNSGPEEYGCPSDYDFMSCITDRRNSLITVSLMETKLIVGFIHWESLVGLMDNSTQQHILHLAGGFIPSEKY